MHAQLARITSALGRVRLAPYDTTTERGRALERERRAALSSLVHLSTKIGGTLISFISVPLAMGHLGVERYGLWMAITSVAVFISFSDLGLGSGLLNAVAESKGKDDETLAARYVSNAFFMVAGVAALLALGLVFVVPTVAWADFLNAESELAKAEARPAVIAFLSCLVLNIPFGLVMRVKSGYQEEFSSALWSFSGSVAAFSALVVAVSLNAGLLWLVLAVASGPVLANATCALFTMRRRRFLIPRFSLIDRAIATRLLRIGFLFLVLQLCSAISTSVDNLIVTRYFGPAVVTEYAITAKLFSVATVLSAAAFGPLWPAYGEAVARGDIEWIRRSLRRTIQLSLVGMGGFCALLCILHPWLLRLWLGPNTPMPGWHLVIAFACWTTVWSSMIPLAMFLNGAGIVGTQLVFATLFAAASLGAKLVAGKVLGTAGLVWGGLFAYVVVALLPYRLLLPRMFAEISGRHPRRPTEG